MSSHSFLESAISLDNLPNFQLPNNSTQIPPVDCMQTATSFVQSLSSLLQSKDISALLILYDKTFCEYSQTLFKNTPWPQAVEIEEANNIEIDYQTQLLYGEMIYRHKFTIGCPITVNDRYYTFQNYKDLLSHTSSLILPCPWIWDIIDEFIYQFFSNCIWRSKIRQSDQEYIEFSQLDEFYSMQEVLEILYNIKNKGSPEFKLFAVVGLMKVKVMVGQFDQAIEEVQGLRFQDMQVICRSFNCYLNFYYYISFAFLMKGSYKEAVNILESLILFTNKYKQFCSKSYSYDMMIKQSEKMPHALAIALVLYPKKIDEIVQNLIQEQLKQKFERLKQYDMSIFNELFTKGNIFKQASPKFFHPYKDFQDSLKDFNEYSLQQQTQIYRDQLAKQFLSIRQLNNVQNILKLYTRISIQKASQLLQVSQEELKSILAKQVQRSIPQSLESPFQEILQNFQIESEQFNYQIEDDMIWVREQLTRTDYAKIYEENNQQVLNLIDILENE